VITGTEQCDDGNDVDGDGCTSACTFTCTSDDDCDDAGPCTADSCSASHTCVSTPDESADGTACSTAAGDGACGGGVCIVGTCGDGELDPGEQCDAGADNSAAAGCQPDCTLGCQEDGDCDDERPCNGTETCVAVADGQTCAAGEPLADETLCAAGYCSGGRCVAAVCGNGTVEPTETCEPPDAGTCNAACQTVICGDGVLVAPDEQCDDGDLDNLDGCDASCRYELVMRWTNAAVLKGPAQPFCVHPGNAFGAALSQEAINQFNVNLNTGIDLGSTNNFFSFIGLDDPSGGDDSSLSLGVLNGVLDPSHGGTFTAGALDWWFLAAPTDIDASFLPKHVVLGGNVTNKSFVAGPTDVALYVRIGTYHNYFELRDMKVKGVLEEPAGVSKPAPPPSQLDPSLVTFESMRADGPDEGFCGAVTVESLNGIPVPEQFTVGTAACLDNCSNSKAYTYCGQGQPVGPGCNSFLDLLVGGCRQTAVCFPGSVPTQPDVGSNGNPAQTLVPDPITNKIDPPVPTDGYSSAFVIEANRAHLTNNLQ
jgi:cysteine-rich repeat protein